MNQGRANERYALGMVACRRVFRRARRRDVVGPVSGRRRFARSGSASSLRTRSRQSGFARVEPLETSFIGMREWT